MKPTPLIITMILIIAILNGASAQKGNNNKTYPAAKKADQVDNYFGTKVADPYRWLEDDQSKETADWVKAENQVTNAYLSAIPFREDIRKRLTNIWNYPKYGVPFKEGNKYFYYMNNGLQNQKVLYMMDRLGGIPAVLLDPNKLSTDGTIAVTDAVPDQDANFLAYSTSKSGSDWNEISVIDIKTRKTLKDQLKWVKFSSISWRKTGFYYSRYEEPVKGQELTAANQNQKVYYHQVGSPQEKDILVYENKDFPMRSYSVEATRDGRFLILYETESTSGNALYVKDLEKETDFIPIAKGFENEFIFIGNDGSDLYILTNQKAPRKKILVVNAEKPNEEAWKNLIPEKDQVMESATLAGNNIVIQYMKDASSRIELFKIDGTFISSVKLPGLGSVVGLSGKLGDEEVFYGYTSFTSPLTAYFFRVQDDVSKELFPDSFPLDLNEFITKQVKYKSKDGTEIPMFLTYKKNLVLDGNNPVLLYGYGGFNESMTPSFSLSRVLFLENGGVYAVPCLRGGGEYGEEWHKAGTKERKQNVFDDFIAAAEYLISEKYTSSAKLAIGGGSNGGLLVGAVMTQRPELFKAALPQVGVMDMLRYHKFTIGYAWASDYGTSDNKDQFRYLYKYSPLHNIREGVVYPATLAFTADHDDRVVPAHTFKFMATLQEKASHTTPLLVRIESKAGHGGGKPTSKAIDEATDYWSFIFSNLGMKPDMQVKSKNKKDLPNILENPEMKLLPAKKGPPVKK